MPSRKSRKTMKKRPLSEWNLFVMEVKKQNPNKMFKDVLKLAGALKKKGVKYADYAKNKTAKLQKKVNKAMKKKGVKNAKNKSVKKVNKALKKTSKK
jgi:hypothetical protein